MLTSSSLIANPAESLEGIVEWRRRSLQLEQVGLVLMIAVRRGNTVEWSAAVLPLSELW
jgi:hypothetical protein